jgi:hypothetical protein
LLRLTNPDVYDNAEIKSWIGNSHPIIAPWYFGDQHRIIAGVWDEDERDLIYNHYCWFTYTNSHFWKTYTPYDTNMFTPFFVGDCGEGCEMSMNDWDRLRNYRVGGWELDKTYPGNQYVSFQRWDGQGEYTFYCPFDVVMKYEGLVEGERNLYQTGYMKIVKVRDLQGWHYYNPPLEIRLINDEEKYYSYEILGRMCGLSPKKWTQS